MSGTKAPMFSVKKVGFVIPKNKLTGSLVPVLRGAKKPGPNDDETNKQVPRNTKWGPDLTQDPAVKKARALAYQTRVEQITEQLKAGGSEKSDLELAGQHQSQDHKSSDGLEIDPEKSERLELEKREAIGEILKLNPSYKAPPDYKPVLKEDRVSIPVKEYPGYNFVGLILGPGGDNQKHLEKETGAKIQLFGTKAESSEKIQIKPSDSNEAHENYEELHVHITADTFEKVDATVAVIELLITSVSENLATPSSTSTPTVTNDAHAPLGQEVTNPDLFHSSTTQPQGQPGYPNHWFPARPLPVSLAPAAHIPPPPQFRTPSNAPPLFNLPPAPTTSFNSHPPPPLPQFVVAQTNLRNPSPDIYRNPSPDIYRNPSATQLPPPRNLMAPSFDNFAFRQMGPQNPAAQMIPRPPRPMHLQAPLPPPPPLVPNFAPQSLSHGFQRPPLVLQPQPQPHVPVFFRNPSRLLGPSSSGLPGFPDLRSFPTPQAPTFPSPSQGNFGQLPQLNTFGSAGEQQLYDPFSLNSMPIVPRQLGGVWRR